MTIRIFNLAKQLKIENKVILDICLKLGFGAKKTISTLSDEDADKVKEYVKNGGGEEKKPDASRDFVDAGASTPAPPAPPRPNASAGKIRIIQPPRGFVAAVDPSKKTTPRPEVKPAPAESDKSPAVSTVEPSPESEHTDKPTNVDAPVVDSEPAAKVESAPKVEPAPKVESSPKVDSSDDEVKSAPAAVESEKPEDKDAEAEKTAAEKDVAEGPVAEKSGSEKNVEEKSAEEKSVPENADVDRAETRRDSVSERPTDARKRSESGAQERVSPLRGALLRGAASRDRESGREGRGSRRDGGRGDASKRPGKTLDPRSTRPAPVASSFISELEASAQNAELMRRPPTISTQNSDRVRVLGQPQRTRRDDENGDSAAKTSAPKSTPALHLAPMPTQSAKTTKKDPKEPAQKPQVRFTPETFRATTGGSSGPLAQHLRKRGGQDQKASADGGQDASGRVDRRSGGRDVVGKNKSGDRVGFADSGSDRGPRKGAGGRDHDRDEMGGRGGDRRNPYDARRQNNKRVRGGDEENDRYVGRSGGRGPRRVHTSTVSTVTAPRKNDVVIEIPCTVKQFAESTGLSVAVVIKKLMELGYMLGMTHNLDPEVIELLIMAFELKATIKREATLEEQYVDVMYDQEDPPESLKPRAPVVTFLGHVDHGKTSLLDRILNLHVVSGEKGGITQHIRAYRINKARGPITFVDTPGHEAFTEMRARGANCTDIVVLVVAADDGVMPQTEEAINHARAAGVPIVVALNKMDLPGVNRDKVISDLAARDLTPSEWGGDVEIVETSAITGMGVDKLLDTLIDVAELYELKANPDRPAMGVVLESSLQSGKGVVCKALVQKGTLRNGDVVLCGSTYGRVRAMTDTLDSKKKIKEAGPSVPITLSGLDSPPDAGSKFVVLDDVSVARQIAEDRAKRSREIELAGSPSHVTLENLFDRINSAKTQSVLNVIIRTDVRGSIEAIRKELGKLDHPEVKIKILQASVGGVTEADVHLADASDAFIVGFNVVPDEGARALAEAKKVQIRRYDVIYKLTEDIRAALQGMLKPIEQVKELGRAVVKRTFNISRVGVIAGCRVLYGVVERDCRIRVVRDSRIIGDYQLDTLKREKDDAKEVREGYECGIKLKNFNDVHEGDLLEAYKMESVARTL